MAGNAFDLSPNSLGTYYNASYGVDSEMVYHIKNNLAFKNAREQLRKIMCINKDKCVEVEFEMSLLAKATSIKDQADEMHACLTNIFEEPEYGRVGCSSLIAPIVAEPVLDGINVRYKIKLRTNFTFVEHVARGKLYKPYPW